MNGKAKSAWLSKPGTDWMEPQATDAVLIRNRQIPPGITIPGETAPEAELLGLVAPAPLEPIEDHDGNPGWLSPASPPKAGPFRLNLPTTTLLAAPRSSLLLAHEDLAAGRFGEALSYLVLWLCGCVGIVLCFR